MSKAPLIINSWLIQATLKFLASESPHLRASLTPTQNNPPIKSVYRDDRQTLLASYELIMTYPEAFAIYSTLEISRQQFGNNRMFEGMHLHTITELWRDLAGKLEPSAFHERAARDADAGKSSPAQHVGKDEGRHDGRI